VLRRVATESSCTGSCAASGKGSASSSSGTSSKESSSSGTSSSKGACLVPLGRAVVPPSGEDVHGHPELVPLFGEDDDVHGTRNY
jgi:hypothetical protein